MALTTWTRLAGESATAYHAFCRYRDFGPTRTVTGAWREAYAELHPEIEPTDPDFLHKAPDSRWHEWARRFDWAGRAEAYDRHMDDVTMEARETAVQGEVIDWVQRRRRQELELWDRGEELIRKAQEMLRHPLIAVQRQVSQEHDRDGHVVKIVNQVINPAHWSMRDAAAMVKTGAEMMQMASDSGLHAQQAAMARGAEQLSSDDFFQQIQDALQRADPAQRDYLIGLYEQWIATTEALQEALGPPALPEGSAA